MAVTPSEGPLKSKKNRRKKRSKIVSFDEEVITKPQAEEILSKIQEEARIENADELDDEANNTKPKTAGQKKRNKQEKRKNQEAAGPQSETIKKPKRKKLDSSITATTNADESTEGTELTPQEDKKTESIREKKRKKYAKIVEDKKNQSELAMQQKSLNYLSRWKHSRSEWKFEKLRQIWLQQNMFDAAKIPNEFWDTLIEYFGNSKGRARDALLKDALKHIENEHVEEETVEANEENENILKRARDIVQHLQE